MGAGAEAAHVQLATDRAGVGPLSGVGAATLAVIAQVHVDGTSTTTDTVAAGSPIRVPLVAPSTLVSIPATVVVPETTENAAAASGTPVHDTW